jgi:4-hydroxy-3-polyprenylbenzoate decarboxylase
MTHRNDPILTVTPGGIFGLNPSTMPAEITTMRRALEERGIPVVGIHSPDETFGMLLIVAVKRTGDANVASQIDHIIHAVMRGRPTMIMVVDEDVNVYDMREVLHTLAARCHPGKGIRVRAPEMCINTAPWLSTEERELSRGANVLFDCTWPVERPKEEIPRRILFRDSFPEEIRDKVLKNWKRYGFK